jgi:hypothetical protein
MVSDVNGCVSKYGVQPQFGEWGRQAVYFIINFPELLQDKSLLCSEYKTEISVFVKITYGQRCIFTFSLN